MQQEESCYDDDDYSDDFASHLGLSSINEDVELCQTTPSSHLTQPQQYTVEEESKDEDDDDNDGSYSVDDFTYISSSTATRHLHNDNDDAKDEEYSVDKHFVSGNVLLVRDESKDNEDTTDGDAPTRGEESKQDDDDAPKDENTSTIEHAPTIGEESKQEGNDRNIDNADGEEEEVPDTLRPASPSQHEAEGAEMMGSKHDDVDVVISAPATNNVEELGPTTPPTHNQTTLSSSSEPLDDEYVSEVDTTFTSTTAVVHSDGVDDNSTTCQLQENTPSRQPQMGNAQTQTEPKSKCKSPQHQTKVIKKPVDFVPRCAYAQTKAMKLRKKKEADEMQEKGQSSSNTNTTKKYSKKRLEQLSKPNKHHLYNDKENIKPPSNLLGKKTKSRKSVGNDNADNDAGSVDYGDDHNDAFLERMDNMEQERRERAELAKQETLYDVRTDKHKCKNCGGTQSYDDMIQGNAYCQNDRCRSGKHKYQPPRQFKVNEFEARQRRCSQRRNYVIDRIKEERRSSIFETSQRKSRLQMELSNKVSKARGGK